MFARPSPAKNGPSNTGSVLVIERSAEYDTHTVAWQKFDSEMTQELAKLEATFRRYFTPQAVVQSLRHK